MSHSTCRNTWLDVLKTWLERLRNSCQHKEGLCLCFVIVVFLKICVQLIGSDSIYGNDTFQNGCYNITLTPNTENYICVYIYIYLSQGGVEYSREILQDIDNKTRYN